MHRQRRLQRTARWWSSARRRSDVHSTHHLVIDLETFATAARDDPLHRHGALRPVVRCPAGRDPLPALARRARRPRGRPANGALRMRQPEKARLSFVGNGSRYCRLPLLEGDLFAESWGLARHMVQNHCTSTPILLDFLRLRWPPSTPKTAPLTATRPQRPHDLRSRLAPRRARRRGPGAEGISPDDLHDPSVDARLTALTVASAPHPARCVA